jgi:hypothetical protein
MPIKYNLTKYDLLAENIHELSQKRDASFSKDEEVLKAEAIIIASFSSSHSWRTYRAITEGNPNNLNSANVKSECTLAMSEKWKHIRNMDVQEVSCNNIRDGLFYMWLSINANSLNRKLYKEAWTKLKEEFDEECDGIGSMQQRNGMI